uniref:Uncharacterized protein n=1 Tax=Sphaerodactylus townsendi TaxID=933632 RepID=A0ACB8GF30_9SAUR
MASKDGATGGTPAGEPDDGTRQVPDKDEIPRDPDLGDEEKDALVPDLHNPPLGRAPELLSFHRFTLALRRQFKDPFEEEKARAQLRQIQQGSQSVSEYISEFRQLARVVQYWPEQVKIHFFGEGLHPEVAQWAMVTAEPTSLVGWNIRAGEAEVCLRRVQLLKQRSDPPCKISLPVSPSPVGGQSFSLRW